jgi:hypothetical protein
MRYVEVVLGVFSRVLAMLLQQRSTGFRKRATLDVHWNLPATGWLENHAACSQP